MSNKNIMEPIPDLNLSNDASSTGLGVVSEVQDTGWFWRIVDRCSHINCEEMKTALLIWPAVFKSPFL